MQFNKIIHIAMLFAILLFAVFVMWHQSIVELFQHVDSIDYYVITMRPEERLKNIELQNSKIIENAANVKFEYVDAIVGKDIDIEKMKESLQINKNPDLVSFLKTIFIWKTNLWKNWKKMSEF